MIRLYAASFFGDQAKNARGGDGVDGDIQLGAQIEAWWQGSKHHTLSLDLLGRLLSALFLCFLYRLLPGHPPLATP